MLRIRSASPWLTKRKVLKSFLRWCARQEWDWLLGLSAPSGATFAQAKGWLDQLVSEIAQADATDAFRCVMFSRKRKRDEPVEFYLLVGGLGSGEWWPWNHRWYELAGGGEADASFEYSYPARPAKLRTVLKELFGRRNLDVEMRLGCGVMRRAAGRVNGKGGPSPQG